MLRPFKVATEALSTEHYPTASAVPPLQYVLLNQLKPNPDDARAVKDMKTAMAADQKLRYGLDKEAFLLLSTASYLDPRFHRLLHLKEESQQAVREGRSSDSLQDSRLPRTRSLCHRYLAGRPTL